ncbi:MAG: hypothetical protein RIR70_1516 [Pseudomonadota bacterium]|jgi:predicted HicB family RNase H-like nuclease
MNTMAYKGYSARIEFDEHDGIHGATLVAAQSAGKRLNQWAAEVLRTPELWPAN